MRRVKQSHVSRSVIFGQPASIRAEIDDSLFGLGWAGLSRSRSRLRRNALSSESVSEAAQKALAVAVRGTVSAGVAAALATIVEPVVSRVGTRRLSVDDALKELTLDVLSAFFVSTFMTNMLKFPVNEALSSVVSLPPLSRPHRDVVLAVLICTLMLPVANYRFRMSLGLESTSATLFMAYVPTLARDLVYGWTRRALLDLLMIRLEPNTPWQRAAACGVAVFCAYLVSSPGNEWRSYALQPEGNKRLSFAEFFDPAKYVRSVFFGGISAGLCVAAGQLLTPCVESSVEMALTRPNLAIAVMTAALTVLLPKSAFLSRMKK